VVFCYFSIRTVLTVWYFVVFHKCWNCPDSVIFSCFSIGTVLTVWYYVIFLLELFQRPVAKYHTFGIFPTSNSKIPHRRNISNVQ
jgi:hypothetical protein